MALKGVKVLEFAGLAPAPFCGMVLRDFGASVIKIDKPTLQEESLDCLSNGKQSIALNLKNPQSTEIVYRLVKTCDVLIEPFRAGVMEKLRLGPNVLMKANPKLVYARLSGYGQEGLYSKRAGHDINYLAISGLLSLFGRHGEKPIFPVNIAADFGGGGLMCALGIALALYERTKSGLGQVVDSSLLHGTAYLGSFLYRSQNLGIWGNERGRNILDSGAPFYEVYKTKDGKYLSVGALEPQFYDALLKGLNISEDEAPQFGNFLEIKEVFNKKFLEKTRDEWSNVFDSLDACVAPVLELQEAPKDPHNIDQDIFIETDSERFPTPAPKLSRSPASPSSVLKAPKVGEHTKIILRELGYDDKVILKMEEQGVIQCYKSSNL